MLKNFYFSLTPAHQDLIFTALVGLGFIAATAFIVIVFILIFKLLWDWIL